MKLKVLSVFIIISMLVLWTASCQQSSNSNSGNSSQVNLKTLESSQIPVSSNKTNINSVNSSQVNQNNAKSEKENPIEPDSEMEGILESSPDADKQPYDLQFIDTMIQHHQAAIVMAKMVLVKSKNQELKKFAQKIIADQESEIEKMEAMRDKWYQFNLDAINMKLPGMTDSMKRMVGKEMDKMEEAEGKIFEEYFLEMMIPHHQGAVLMAKDALQKAERAEIKKIAEEIINLQEGEIQKMTDWKEAQN